MGRDCPSRDRHGLIQVILGLFHSGVIQVRGTHPRAQTRSGQRYADMHAPLTGTFTWHVPRMRLQTLPTRKKSHSIPSLTAPVPRGKSYYFPSRGDPRSGHSQAGR